MGFFSCIIEAGKSIVSGITKIASGIAPVVVNATKSLLGVAVKGLSAIANCGGFIGGLAAGAGKLLGMATAFISGPLGPIVGTILAELIVKAISAAIEWVGKKLGIIDKEESTEEVGYRLDEASRHEDWKKREEFDSFADYNEYLKEKIPTESIDRVRLENNKFMYMGLGTMAIKEGIEAKYGLDMPVDFLIELGKCKLNGQELDELLLEFMAKKYDLSLFRQYLQGELKGDMKRNVEAAIIAALSRVAPEKSHEELKAYVNSLKNASRDDGEVIKKYGNEFDKLLEKSVDSQTAADIPNVIY